MREGKQYVSHVRNVFATSSSGPSLSAHRLHLSRFSTLFWCKKRLFNSPTSLQHRFEVLDASNASCARLEIWRRARAPALFGGTPKKLTSCILALSNLRVQRVELGYCGLQVMGGDGLEGFPHTSQHSFCPQSNKSNQHPPSSHIPTP
jgi:hypothetical protein